MRQVQIVELEDPNFDLPSEFSGSAQLLSSELSFPGVSLLESIVVYRRKEGTLCAMSNVKVQPAEVSCDSKPAQQPFIASYAAFLRRMYMLHVYC